MKLRGHVAMQLQWLQSLKQRDRRSAVRLFRLLGWSLVMRRVLLKFSEETEALQPKRMKRTLLGFELNSKYPRCNSMCGGGIPQEEDGDHREGRDVGLSS